MPTPGQPKLFNPTYCELARHYCLVGATANPAETGGPPCVFPVSPQGTFSALIGESLAETAGTAETPASTLGSGLVRRLPWPTG
jgi:hypothetical protein